MSDAAAAWPTPQPRDRTIAPSAAPQLDDLPLFPGRMTRTVLGRVLVTQLTESLKRSDAARIDQSCTLLAEIWNDLDPSVRQSLYGMVRAAPDALRVLVEARREAGDAHMIALAPPPPKPTPRAERALVPASAPTAAPTSAPLPETDDLRLMTRDQRLNVLNRAIAEGWSATVTPSPLLRKIEDRLRVDVAKGQLDNVVQIVAKLARLTPQTVQTLHANEDPLLLAACLRGLSLSASVLAPFNGWAEHPANAALEEEAGAALGRRFVAALRTGEASI